MGLRHRDAPDLRHPVPPGIGADRERPRPVRQFSDSPAPGATSGATGAGATMLWRDGTIVPDAGVLDDTDRGLTLGDGLFDTALALGGRVAFEEAHIARLVAGAETLGIPAEADRIRAAVRALAGQGHGSWTTAGDPHHPHPRLRPARAEAAAGSASDPVRHRGAERQGAAFAPLRLWPTGIARNDTSPAARLKTWAIWTPCWPPARPPLRASTKPCSATHAAASPVRAPAMCSRVRRQADHAAARRRRARRDRPRGGAGAGRGVRIAPGGGLAEPVQLLRAEAVFVTTPCGCSPP